MAVFVADEQSGTGQQVDAGRLHRLAMHVLAERRVPRDMELSVLCIDEPAMAELNARHMDSDGPTDVLAFPMDTPGEVEPGGPAVLGDVVLCPVVAARQAAEQGHPVQAELDLLLVHGILHLLGFDHAEEAEAREMFGLTAALLDSFAAAEDVGRGRREEP